MNEYFTSIDYIGPNLAAQVFTTNIESDSYVDRAESTSSFNSIGVNEAHEALDNLKTSKSFGPDKIPARFGPDKIPARFGPDEIPARLLKDSCFSAAPFLTKILMLR